MINWSNLKSVKYYLQHREIFSIFWPEANSWGQTLFNKKTNTYRTPKTCKENGINFHLFVTGQLKYRLMNNNADY